jgi:hypothetical protein
MPTLSMCNCNVCRTVGDLKLKVIAHSGEAIVTQIGGSFAVPQVGPIITKQERASVLFTPADPAGPSKTGRTRAPGG